MFTTPDGDELRIKSRHHLRSNSAKKIVDELNAVFGSEVEQFLNGKQLEMAETDDRYELMLVDGEPLLMMVDGRPFPTIKGALKLKPKKRLVVVDMGAVEFISKGADVMCPGIVDADLDIKKGDLVIITDEVHGKAMAVGRAIMSGEQMIGNRGKAIKSLHWVGDKIWNLSV